MRCHTVVAHLFPLSRALPIPSPSPPSLLFRKLSTKFYRNTRTIATWSCNTKLEGTTCFPNHKSRQQPKMDSMPIQTVPVPSSDPVKIPEPETKIQHVENINATATTPHRPHLPSGVSETEDEKKSNWFIGSIDCGTTSSRFLIFDGEGSPVASHQIEFENIYPESG